MNSKIKPIYLGAPPLFAMALAFLYLITLGGLSTQPVAAAPAASTWYVDGATGDDLNSCTSPGDACETIAGAAGKAAAGDTIIIAAGVYTENLFLSNLNLIGAGIDQTIIDGSASGRVLRTSGSFSVTHLTIQNGLETSTIGGGGIYNQGTLHLDFVKIINNIASNGSGGGIKNNGILTVEHSEIVSNTASASGGGVVHQFSLVPITITQSTIAFNQASIGGGASIGHGVAGGSLYMRDNVIHGNTGSTYGGGLELNNVSVTIENTTFSGNSSPAQVGALYIYNEAAVTLTNVTIAENGGNAYAGILNASGVLTLTNVTIADNTSGNPSTSSGLAAFSNARTYIYNSLFSGNSPRNCLNNGVWISGGYNLSSDTYCHLNATGDQQPVNALLYPLGDYGGATPTLALQPESPARDAANDAVCPTEDQRSFSRPFDGNGDSLAQCDIGAFEARSQVTVADLQAPEGDTGTSTAHFVVTVFPTATQPISIAYNTIAGSASAGSDYLSASGMITFTTGEITQTVPISILGDIIDELDETFFLAITTTAEADIITLQANGTIVDDDGLPSLSVDDQTLLEGNLGTQVMQFTVSLSPASLATVEVDANTADGSAQSGLDYVGISEKITFTPGETEKIVQVTINSDFIDEGDEETFTLNLSNPVNAQIVDGVGLGTIEDNDTARISIYRSTQVEGDFGTTDMVFSVTLTTETSFMVTVDYATEQEGILTTSATADVDFITTTGTLTFNPGETEQTVNVPIIGDRIKEVDETLTLRLNNANPIVLALNSAKGNILDDDDMFELYLPLLNR